jgi:hypothetical protein
VQQSGTAALLRSTSVTDELKALLKALMGIRCQNCVSFGFLQSAGSLLHCTAFTVCWKALSHDSHGVYIAGAPPAMVLHAHLKQSPAENKWCQVAGASCSL